MRFKQGADPEPMKKAKISGVLTALLGLGFLIFLLVKGANFPASQWPYEAFQGLLFSFSWVFGFSENTSYLITAIFVISMAALCFFLGYKIHHIIFDPSQK